MSKDVKKEKIAKIRQTKEEYFRKQRKEKELDDLFTQIICAQSENEKAVLTAFYIDKCREA